MNVDKDTCIGCGACAGVCPVEALAFDDDGKMECDRYMHWLSSMCWNLSSRSYFTS